MSGWTVAKGDQVIGVWSAPMREWHVGAEQVGWVATIRVSDTDEGRSVVAKMVAALQMEEALGKLLADGLTADDVMLLFLAGGVTGEQQEKFRPTVERLRAARTGAVLALEASKRLP